MTLAEKIRPAFGLVDSKPKWMSRIDNIPYDKEDLLSQAAHHIKDLVIIMLHGSS